ncbi:MAG: gamma-glutamylcyclotransferase [Actinobacteria bacterium]|nr:gamma-glutamylcyclotransferase [Actinomycetota bacterium]
MQFIFAYGSLAADLRGHHPAVLRGRRRGWGVAMDNRVDVPGYKHYRLRADGSRPPVFVAFLDLFEDAAAGTHGLCVPVDDAQLPVIDHRERNYERIDVTAAVTPVHGTVWAYVGSSSGRRRLRRARDDRAAVVSRDYLERTRVAFAALGTAALADFEATAADADLPVWDLERVELAPAP